MWVSGLIAPAGPPGRILDAIAAGLVEPVASWPLAEEIVEVLRRPRIRRFGINEEDAKTVLRLLAPLLPSVEVDVETRDPDDAPVIGAAIAGRADAILTGDSGLLEDESLRVWLRERGIELLSPSQLIAHIEGGK